VQDLLFINVSLESVFLLFSNLNKRCSIWNTANLFWQSEIEKWNCIVKNRVFILIKIWLLYYSHLNVWCWFYIIFEYVFARSFW